jgi:anti-sigma regulatory factor (Ser/Thr protein kinase)
VLDANRTLFESQLSAGAARVRVVGHLPGISPSTWPRWARYEAVVNRRFADLAVSALCAYDAREVSDAVLDDVRRLHLALADHDGQHVPSADFVEPETFLHEWSRAVVDAIEDGEPELVMADPEPWDARRAVALMATDAGVPAEETACTVSEALTNARLHGRPPVTLRAWTQPGRLVVTVADGGPGPSDPLAGLLPPDPELTHGRGLWIAHHSCSFFAVSSDDDGCVARMVVEAPTRSPG